MKIKLLFCACKDNSISWLPEVGNTPYHLTLAPSGRFLYASLNRPGQVVKIDLVKWEIASTISTGEGSRGMDISPDGQILYVANYNENTLSKIYTKSFEIVETLKTNEKPVDVCMDIENHHIWVACYTGTIMIFKDNEWMAPKPPITRQRKNRIELSDELSSAPQRSRSIRYSYLPKSSDSELVENPYYYIYQSPEASNPFPQQEKSAYASSHSNKSFSPERSSDKSSDSNQSDLNSRLYSSRSSGSPSSSYYLIVGSYAQQGSALDKVKELKSIGFHSAEILENDKRFRVSCKRVDDIDGARKAQEELQNNHQMKAWILKQ